VWAYQNSLLQSQFTFARAVTITVRYSDADARDLNEDTLGLYYGDGIIWRADDIALVERDVIHNHLAATVGHLTEFGLFGRERDYQVYLPLAIKH